MSDAAAAPAPAPALSSEAAPMPATSPASEERQDATAAEPATTAASPAKRKPLVFSDSPVEETGEASSEPPNDPSDEQIKKRLDTIGEKIKKLPPEERHKFEMRLDGVIKGAIIEFGDELERTPANGHAPPPANGHTNGASTNGASSATKKIDLAPAKKKIDPHGFPEHFAPLESSDRIWTWGAILKSAYEFEGKTSFRSLKGLLLGRIDRPSGITIFSFELNSSLLVQVPTGAFVVAQKGEVVICHASDSLRVQLKELYDYQRAQTERGGAVTRHCHVQVRPTGTWQLCHGLDEGTFEVQSEPDDSGRPKLFDRAIERAA